MRTPVFGVSGSMMNFLMPTLASTTHLIETVIEYDPLAAKRGYLADDILPGRLFYIVQSVEECLLET